MTLILSKLSLSMTKEAFLPKLGESNQTTNLGAGPMTQKTVNKLCLWSSSLLKHLKSSGRWSKVPELQLLRWETRMELLGPSECSSPNCCACLVSETSSRSNILSLSLCHSTPFCHCSNNYNKPKTTSLDSNTLNKRVLRTTIISRDKLAKLLVENSTHK